MKAPHEYQTVDIAMQKIACITCLKLLQRAYKATDKQIEIVLAASVANNTVPDDVCLALEFIKKGDSI